MGAGLPLVAVFVIVLLAYCCWHREVVGKHHCYHQQHFQGQNSIVSVLVLLVPKTSLCAEDLDLKHFRIISGIKYNKTFSYCRLKPDACLATPRSMNMKSCKFWDVQLRREFDLVKWFDYWALCLQKDKMCTVYYWLLILKTYTFSNIFLLQKMSVPI